MAFSTGDLIGGRYRLDELIGAGGMGQVFRAHDSVLARAVAIKLVDGVEARRRDEIMQVFLREARISAAIDHRNVVRLLDFGNHAATVPFMVMELLEGESLGDVLSRGDAMPFEWLLGVVTQVLDGLAAAHDVGVVHRDLKPENIFLTRDRGRIYPKILDFGISKLLDSDGTARVTTAHGHVVGTPAYMSPEQARGVRTIDQRTDIYSMGVVLYELLCGEMPFYSENPGDLMLMIMTTEAPSLVSRVPEVGKALSDVVAKAMSKRPDDRFASAREMQEAVLEAAHHLMGPDAAERLDARMRPASWRATSGQLQTIVEPRTEHAKEVPSLPPRRAASTASKTKPRDRRILMAAVSAGALALGIGGALLLRNRSSADPAPRYIVVHAEPAATSPSPATQPLEPPPSTAPAAPVPTKNRKEPAAISSKGAPRTTAEVLADSFRRQKAPVVACLNEHAAEIGQIPKLSVKFSLAREGDVVRAAVYPAELSRTGVGSCIETAVRAMRFPEQPDPISFEVPLTARKGG